jgi:hypothetical protein
LDRLVRSLLKSTVLLEELRQQGVRLVIVTAPELGKAAGDNLMLNILASFAEFEREVVATLRNPVYIGMFQDRGSRQVGCHDPIIATELFESVGAQLDSRQTRVPGQGFLGIFWPLRGWSAAGSAIASWRRVGVEVFCDNRHGVHVNSRPRGLFYSLLGVRMCLKCCYDAITFGHNSHLFPVNSTLKRRSLCERRHRRWLRSPSGPRNPYCNVFSPAQLRICAGMPTLFLIAACHDSLRRKCSRENIN